MSTVTTYTAARARLRKLCDRVVATREPVFIRRRKGGDVALVSAAELRGLLSTVHLLRSPDNARHLLSALAKAEAGRGRRRTPSDLRRELGLAST